MIRKIILHILLQITRVDWRAIFHCEEVKRKDADVLAINWLTLMVNNDTIMILTAISYFPL